MTTNSIAAAWQKAWQRRHFRARFFVTIPFLALMLLGLANFLQWVERRPGVAVPDPVLAVVPPTDLNWIIFIIIYGGLVCALLLLIRDPDRLLLAFQSYSLVAVFRILAMYLLPLDPPATTIPLRDPFVQLFGGGNVLMKDLFFSGHTSTVFLLFLTAQSRRWKLVFLLCTIAVGVMVVIHHSHYAVDVYIAPFVVYASYRIAYLLSRKFDPTVSSE